MSRVTVTYRDGFVQVFPDGETELTPAVLVVRERSERRDGYGAIRSKIIPWDRIESAVIE